MGKAKDSLTDVLGKQGMVWSEMDHFKADHSKFCDDWKEQKRKDCEARVQGDSGVLGVPIRRNDSIHA